MLCCPGTSPEMSVCVSVVGFLNTKLQRGVIYRKTALNYLEHPFFLEQGLIGILLGFTEESQINAKLLPFRQDGDFEAPARSCSLNTWVALHFQSPLQLEVGKHV